MINKLLEISQPNEEWRPVVGYEDKYQISNIGRIAKVHPDFKLLIPTDHRGYHKIMLFKNYERRKHSVHRLVAFAFIPNPENKPDINHKDRIKDNNCVENLEWVTSRENNKHYLKSINWKPAIRQYKIPNLIKNNRVTNKTSRMVYVYNTEGIFIKEIFGLQVTAKQQNTKPRSIYKAIKKKQSHKGFRYSYIKEETINCSRKPRKFGIPHKSYSLINKHLKGSEHERAKVFYKYNIELTIIEEYKGISAYAKMIGSTHKNIGKAIKNKYKHMGFYYSLIDPRK